MIWWWKVGHAKHFAWQQWMLKVLKKSSTNGLLPILWLHFRKPVYARPFSLCSHIRVRLCHRPQHRPLLHLRDLGSRPFLRSWRTQFSYPWNRNSFPITHQNFFMPMCSHPRGWWVWFMISSPRRHGNGSLGSIGSPLQGQKRSQGTGPKKCPNWTILVFKLYCSMILHLWISPTIRWVSTPFGICWKFMIVPSPSVKVLTWPIWRPTPRSFWASWQPSMMVIFAIPAWWRPNRQIKKFGRSSPSSWRKAGVWMIVYMRWLTYVMIYQDFFNLVLEFSALFNLHPPNLLLLAQTARKVKVRANPKASTMRANPKVVSNGLQRFNEMETSNRFAWSSKRANVRTPRVHFSMFARTRWRARHVERTMGPCRMWQRLTDSLKGTRPKFHPCMTRTRRQILCWPTSCTCGIQFKTLPYMFQILCPAVCHHRTKYYIRRPPKVLLLLQFQRNPHKQRFQPVFQHQPSIISLTARFFWIFALEWLDHSPWCFWNKAIHRFAQSCTVGTSTSSRKFYYVIAVCGGSHHDFSVWGPRSFGTAPQCDVLAGASGETIPSTYWGILH